MPECVFGKHPADPFTNHIWKDLSMERDILLGQACFERICINIMCPNTTGIPPDREVISAFMDTLYPKYRDDARIDILIENTDFGVGD